jgi:hypothetical protein
MRRSTRFQAFTLAAHADAKRKAQRRQREKETRANNSPLAGMDLRHSRFPQRKHVDPRVEPRFVRAKRLPPVSPLTHHIEDDSMPRNEEEGPPPNPPAH